MSKPDGSKKAKKISRQERLNMNHINTEINKATRRYKKDVDALTTKYEHELEIAKKRALRKAAEISASAKARINDLRKAYDAKRKEACKKIDQEYHKSVKEIRDTKNETLSKIETEMADAEQRLIWNRDKKLKDLKELRDKSIERVKMDLREKK